MAIQRHVQRFSASASLRAFGLVAVAASMAFVACGGGDEGTQGETGQPPTAASPAQPPNAPAATPSGESAAFEVVGQLPKEYPSDLPIYPEATPANSMLIPGIGGIVSFTTDAGPPEVYAFFQEKLPAQGWSVKDATEKPPRIEATKGQRHTIIQMRPRDGGGSEILLAIEGI